ncbi:hypothetical protein EPB68_09485 [Enterococcus faecalis]|nr:hypothetical protein EPB68_09485 [Enterococcus faecalis]
MSKTIEKQMMTLEEQLGERCAQVIQKTFQYAILATVEERLILVNRLRKDADKQSSAAVRSILLEISELIEKMESN